MKPFKNLSISFCCFVNTLIFIALLAHAARFDIKNNCNITIWAAAVPGGGGQINPGGTWSLEVLTECSFNGSGVGTCQTGDCGGLIQSQGSGYGAAPHTLAEFTLSLLENLDFYDISLVNGFNVPMLKAPGWCNNPCTVFKTKEYCCNAGPADCKATNYSMFLKGGCPGDYSFPLDDKLSTYTCPSGNKYNVVFCPLGSL
ncbi:hypothetical protein ACB098_10G063000 [Castanea mollissima]